MRAILLICAVICAIIPVVLSLDPNWHLVFSDEFNGDSIDTNKWNLRDQQGNVGNGELQYYDPSCISVYDGNLVITANNITAKNGMKYVSGWVDTQNKFYTTYGRYEFSARMPAGHGMWPAIWLLSQELCWPMGSEFDIMEYRGSFPNDGNGFYHYGTCCGCNYQSAGSTKTLSTSYADGFHTFALEWLPDTVTWYVDNAVFLTFNRANLQLGLTEFDPTPHYIIINSAIGGGYPGNPDNTTPFPNKLLIDYVRVYEYATCTGNTCSGHGCCDLDTLVCTCDAGWAGTYCEQQTGLFDDKFITTNVQYTPATDVKVNGWDNGFAFYSDTNVQIQNGLTLTLTNHNCPGGCAGMGYSGGAWNSAQYFSYGTFTFVAKGPRDPGTGFSLQAAGQNSAVMEQISFVLTGANRTFAQLVSFHLNYQYVQEAVALGFDASEDFHTYTFVYNPANISYYIDGKLLKTTTVVIPNVTLAMGVYYTAQPAWYNNNQPFKYNGPSTTSVSEASWTINPASAKCSNPAPTPTPTKSPPPPTPGPTPAPGCQPSHTGTGAGLTGDYFDGDTSSASFVNYKLTRVDSTINFNWGSGSPASNIGSDNFSVRWTGQVQPLYSGVYTFYSTSDDGIRLWVNGQKIIDAWVIEAATEHCGTISLTSGQKYDIIVEYAEVSGDASEVLSWSSNCQSKQVIPQSQLYPCHSPKNAGGNGLVGFYYSDENLRRLRHYEVDSNINFNWGNGGPAGLGGQVDQFSVQWFGIVQPRYSGAYTFYATTDDGSRLYIGNQEIVNRWVIQAPSETAGTINLVQGQNYSIIFQYFEANGGAEATLSWSNACEAKQIIPQSQFFVHL